MFTDTAKGWSFCGMLVKIVLYQDKDEAMESKYEYALIYWPIISEACKFARREARKTNCTVEVVLIGELVE